MEKNFFKHNIIEDVYIVASANLNFKIPKKIISKNIIFTDSSAFIAKKQNINPCCIIGDLDSINKDVLEFFKNKTQIIHIKDQNSTDLDKAISYCIQKFPDSKINILNSIGGNRPDHTLYNFYIAKKYFPTKIEIIQKLYKTIYTKNSTVHLNCKINQNIGIFQASQNKTFVTSRGLKYELQNYELIIGQKTSACNTAASKVIEINIQGEAILTLPLNAQL